VGGGIVPALGASRTRLISATGALVVAGTLGGLPAALGGNRRPVLIALALVGLGAAVVALVGRFGAAWWSVAALGTEYAVFLLGRGTPDARAPIVGIALFLLPELIDRSNQAGFGERPSRTRRVVEVGALCLAALAVGALVVMVGQLGARGGVIFPIVGTVAAVGLIGLVLPLVRRAYTPGAGDGARRSARSGLMAPTDGGGRSVR
jgi:hypothetical protein